MENLNKFNLLAASFAVLMLATGCGGSSTGGSSTGGSSTGGVTMFQQPTAYTGFPITLKDATHDSNTSVAYTGQMARHVLRLSVKEVFKAPVAPTNAAATIAEVNGYIKNENNVIDDTAIKAPADKNEFVFKERVNSDISTGKNLYGKTYDTEKNGDPIPGVADADKAITLGVPGNKTAKETLDLWVRHFAENLATTSSTLDETNGYNYRQLVTKYLMGAVFYSESVNHYLDENLEDGVKDNNLPYNPGKHYTGKEHSWDEGFGYFGAAAHFQTLTAEQNYQINKKGKSPVTQADALGFADEDGDGKVSHYTEYNSGPAYYATVFDRGDGGSTYGNDIMEGWLKGRTIITNAVDENGDARKLTSTERNTLKTIAKDEIQRNWELVFAEAVFRYAGLSFVEIEKLELNPAGSTKDYYKLWGEMKGFMLALQFGGAISKIDKNKFLEIDNLIGYGPVQPDGDQVNGVTGTGAAETFTHSTGNTLADYKENLKQVQVKLGDFYALKALQNDKR